MPYKVDGELFDGLLSSAHYYFEDAQTNQKYGEWDVGRHHIAMALGILSAIFYNVMMEKEQKQRFDELNDSATALYKWFDTLPRD